MPSLEEIQENQFFKDVYIGLGRYCAYQERSSGEVMKKLEKYALPEKNKMEIFEKLKNNGFFNDARYAEAYINGKLRGNQWGWLKIKNGLIEKGINSQIIEVAHDQIDKDEYVSVMEKVLKQKANLIKDKDSYIRKNKIARFMLSRGFENHLVWQLLADLSD